MRWFKKAFSDKASLDSEFLTLELKVVSFALALLATFLANEKPKNQTQPLHSSVVKGLATGAPVPPPPHPHTTPLAAEVPFC